MLVCRTLEPLQPLQGLDWNILRKIVSVSAPALFTKCGSLFQVNRDQLRAQLMVLPVFIFPVNKTEVFVWHPS